MLFSKIDLMKLQEASPFNTVDEMDKHIYEYIQVLKNEVAKSVIDVLYALGRSSLRVVGISFKKQITIAEELKVSRKTVNKAVKILREIGVIDTVQTSTKAGRPSVLVYRILPFCSKRLQVVVTSGKVEKANNSGGLNVINEFEPIKAETYTKHEGKEEAPVKIDETYLPKDVNKEFIRIVKPFFGFNKVFRFWGIVRNAIREVHGEYTGIRPNDVVNIAIDVFKRTVFGYKRGFVKKFEGYFFVELCRELSAEVRRQSSNNRMFLNWLEG